jgi:hypothetical protein
MNALDANVSRKAFAIAMANELRCIGRTIHAKVSANTKVLADTFAHA